MNKITYKTHPWIHECIACGEIGDKYKDKIVILNNPGGYGKPGAFIHLKCIDTPSGRNYSERLKEIGYFG